MLVPLLRRVSGIDRWVELDTEDFHNKDYVQIESTELPYVFRTTLDSIPVKYLTFVSKSPRWG